MKNIHVLLESIGEIGRGNFIVPKRKKRRKKEKEMQGDGEERKWSREKKKKNTSLLVKCRYKRDGLSKREAASMRH